VITLKKQVFYLWNGIGEEDDEDMMKEKVILF